MKTKNMLLCLLLCCCLLLTVAPAAAAAEEPLTPLPYSVGLLGKVIEVNPGQIVVEYSESADGESKTSTWVLNIGEDTACVDNATGQAADIGEIKAGDTIYAYRSPIATFSLPPQSPALAILVNIGDSVPAHLHFIESVTQRADGSIRFLSDNGSIYVTVDADTQLLPYRTKNIVTIDQLQPGSVVLAWYDVVLTSYPGQTGASRIVLLRNPEDASGLPLNVAGAGKTLPVTGKMEDGLLLAPLRAVAEALGFDVLWEQSTHSVLLGRDDISATLTIGKDSFQLKRNGVTTTHSLPRAPYVVAPGITWAPAELFNTLIGAGAMRYDGQGITFVPEGSLWP